ncbi:MAG: hypothetical protein DRQ02_07135 [Candidatus Latescibacterota bacterium]|nr:MAG: hypothetical protein DRQ02_07135 [Candidatus Latescibacterota bacterium]RKY72496.1 MAG: hypothetical protein DRQ24_04860 [Candidatus Latescibacterota bacterium]
MSKIRNPEAKPKPTVTDQRVRVLFSTHIQTDVSHAESIFGVIEHPIKLPECRDWVEPQPMTTPQVCFAELSDGKQGVFIPDSEKTPLKIFHLFGGFC